MIRAIAPFAALLCASHGVVAADLAAPGLEGVTLEDLQATRSLPLFSPTRRAPLPPAPVIIEETTPVEQPTPSVPAQASPEDFLLVGVLLSGSLEVALLRDGKTGIVTRVPSGNDYGDWKLTVLGPRQIRLEGKGESVVQSLFQSRNETASIREVEAETNSTGLWR